MNDACHSNRSDLASGWKALVAWWIPTGILVAAAFSNSPLVAVIWPILLVWMGVACLVNAKRCGRRHCYVTGPFFLGLAVVSLFYGLGILALGPNGWKTLAGILLLGSCALTCLPEWIWGRYVVVSPSQPSEKRS